MGLKGVVAGFTGTDAVHLSKISNEHFAITDLAGAGAVDDGINGFFQQLIGYRRFDFDLGQEVDGVFGASLELGRAGVRSL